MNTVARIQRQIDEHKVLLYMKGSPDFPQCGFSAKVASILQQLGSSFAYVDILANPDIRSELPKYADWPTFPQLYIAGDLIGGCDIVTEMYATGELEPMLQRTGALGSVPVQIVEAE